MVEKHQSALLQTFNKKKHAYLSKIQVHRNSFVWRNGFHYSPHPIELHFMKFKWSFFFNYKERCLAVIEPNHVDLSFFEWVSSMSFFFFSSKCLAMLYFVHCQLSRKDIALFFSVNRIRCVWKHWDFDYLFFVQPQKNKDSKASIDRLRRIFERGL